MDVSNKDNGESDTTTTTTTTALPPKLTATGKSMTFEIHDEDGNLIFAV